MAEQTQTQETPSLADLRATFSAPAPAVDETGKPTTPVAPTTTAPATPAAEPPAAPSEPEAPAAPAEPPATTDPPATTEGDRKPKRFSELTRRAQTAESERDTERAERLRLEAEVARLKAAPGSQVEPVAPAEGEIPELPGKPTAPDAKNWSGTWDELEAAKAKYTTDMISWGVKNERHRETITNQREQAKQHTQSVESRWQQAYSAALEVDAEVEAAVKNVGSALSRALPGIGAVIKESEVSVEIMQFLHKDAAALEKLTKQSLASAARTIGNIEAAIIGKKSTAPTTTSLPSPPQQVGGHATGTQQTAPIDPSKLSMGDLREWVKKNAPATSASLFASRRKVL